MVRSAHYFGFERKIGRGRAILAIRLVSGVRTSNTLQLENLQDLYVHELKTYTATLSDELRTPLTPAMQRKAFGSDLPNTVLGPTFVSFSMPLMARSEPCLILRDQRRLSQATLL